MLELDRAPCILEGLIAGAANHCWGAIRPDGPRTPFP
jgi:hypothetical protein